MGGAVWPQVWPSVTSSRTEWRLWFTLTVALAHRAPVFQRLSPLLSPPQASLRLYPSGRIQRLQRRAAVPWPPRPPMDPWAPAPHPLRPVPWQTPGLGLGLLSLPPP